MKVRDIQTDNAHEWALSNGSRVMASHDRRRQLHATLVIGDEFDLWWSRTG